jgi:hypothetical protein
MFSVLTDLAPRTPRWSRMDYRSRQMKCLLLGDLVIGRPTQHSWFIIALKDNPSWCITDSYRFKWGDSSVLLDLEVHTLCKFRK